MIETIDGILCYKKTPVRDMLAFPYSVACCVLGIGRSTLYKLIGLGLITPTTHGTISRAECERYLSDTTPK